MEPSRACALRFAHRQQAARLKIRKRCFMVVCVDQAVLPPFIFFEFVFITADVVTRAEHKVAGEGSGHGAADIVLCAELLDAYPAVEDIESGQSGFDAVVFTEESANGSVPDWNFLVKSESVVSVKGIIQVAFEEEFWCKLPFYSAFEAMVLDGLILGILEGVSEVIESQFSTGGNDEAADRGEIEVHFDVVSGVSGFILDVIDEGW